VGPRASLDGHKISSPLGSDPGLSSPQSVAILTELLSPHSVGSPQNLKETSTYCRGTITLRVWHTNLFLTGTIIHLLHTSVHLTSTIVVNVHHTTTNALPAAH